MRPNRWLIAGASCITQAALGSVYASSVFLVAFMEHYAVSRREANLAFTITILALGLTAGFGGALQPRFGPRVIATAGGVLYGGGLALAGVAPNLPLLYLSYGVIGGIGLGLGYIVPLAMLVRWFPDRRGFITGLAVAGFGAGAALAGPIAASLLAAQGLRTALIELGAAYLLLCAGAAQFFRAAPENYVPRGWTPAPMDAQVAQRDWSLAEALRSPSWHLLWLLLALNVMAGAALISVASPLAQELAQVNPARATLAVIAIAAANGLGRIFWGWASDRIGRSATFIALFAVQFAAFAGLAHVANLATLVLLAALIGLCFGGGFAVMPAFTVDFFGAKNAGAIYGAMLTAWGAGAVAGPQLIASLDYRSAATIIALVMLGSMPLAFLARGDGLATIFRRLTIWSGRNVAPLPAGHD
jgi:MFS transporter, OFA family, oxalate/formate antiporter